MDGEFTFNPDGEPPIDLAGDAWMVFHPDPENAQAGDPVTIQPVKLGQRLPMSVEMLLWAGQITEEQAIEMGWTPPPPVPRLRRWRYAVELWWFDHRPTLHLGPCNHEDCL